MSLRLTDKAEEDLINILLYGIQTFGLRQAQAYRDKIGQSLDLIGDNPDIAPLRQELSPPARVHPVGVHIIIYETDDRGEAIILRVRSSRENWQYDEDY